ncbi:MAG: signal recognition particle protein [Oscillospiraceae bacterium]|nr:signal recognition particle protein [Oscillospiraceae bacterium]
MAFEGLSEKLNGIFKTLRGKGRLSESDVRTGMREVRLALLEADVSYKVVKEFVTSVTERCVGSDVLDSLTPAQQIIKIVNEELTRLMGTTNAKLTQANRGPTVVMMVGLQGAGKTTNGAKLAGLMRRQFSKRPLLVACDVYRPAAITQLQVVGKQLDIPVFEMGQADPVKIATEAVKYAADHGHDMVFLDTAGRLHIDETLMDELKNIKSAVRPNEIMLVVDAMTGQDAVNVAAAFDEVLGIDGVLLTKLDGDARGGAALSIRATTGKPIKFVGTGEKLDMIEAFHPDRMASRILGMGDMLTFIEKAEQQYDEKQAKKLEEKLKKNRFTLSDYLEQLEQLQNMGDLNQIASMLPGGMGKGLDMSQIDEKKFARTKAIIQSMTIQERENPSVLNASRRRRIAAGCGQEVSDVNRLIKSYEAMQEMTKAISRGNLSALGMMGHGKGKKMSSFGRKKRLK